MEESGKKGFSGQLGFVLAAAGSAVGVGNLWRFPYLAAKDGGGLFIIIYVVLVLTFGYVLLTSDIAIGRRTQMNSIRAYDAMKPGWKFLGIITFLVPVLIMTYYAVIGGWILKYAVSFLTGQGSAAADGSYFTNFITNPVEAGIYAAVFMLITAFIVFQGVEKGIEACSRILMPVLLVSIILIACYALTLHHTDDAGVTRTGLQGLAVYFRPDFTGLTPRRFLSILLDAMSQIFFSLSVSMGIMITSGSYIKKDVNLNQAVSRIELFDTGVALLAGAMIIPSIYVFEGMDGMASGPKLMFVSLPKVFAAMGPVGGVVGAVFFIMAVFATLTSCISVMEAITANCMEIFHVERKPTAAVLGLVYTVISVIIALGYSIFYVELTLPNGSIAQLLDLMDYISNSCMMPFISLLSAILIGWIVGPKWISDEMEADGSKMRRKGLYSVIIRFVAPVIMGVLFLQAVGVL